PSALDTSFAYEPTEAATIPRSAGAATVTAETESVDTLMAVARPRRRSVVFILIAALATVVAAGTIMALRGGRKHASTSSPPRAVVPTATPAPAPAEPAAPT